MVVLDPNLDEPAIEAFNQRLERRSPSAAALLDSEPWGRRRLAYPIGRYRDGFYILSHLRLDRRRGRHRARAEAERERDPPSAGAVRAGRDGRGDAELAAA